MQGKPNGDRGGRVSAQTISDCFGFSREQVYALVQGGHLPVQRVGRGPFKFSPDDVAEWRKGNPRFEDAVRLAGLSIPEAEDLVKAGMLPCVTVRGHRFVPASDLHAWRGYAGRCEHMRATQLRTDSTAGYVYFLGAAEVGLVKIGWSSRSHSKRPQEVAAASPVALAMLAVKPGGAREEALLHDRFALGRRRGEWFDNRTPGLAAEIAACRRQFGRPVGLNVPSKF